VRRNEFRGHIDSPKGGKARTMLAAAFHAARHLRADPAFSGPGGELLTEELRAGRDPLARRYGSATGARRRQYRKQLSFYVNLG